MCPIKATTVLALSNSVNCMSPWHAPRQERGSHMAKTFSGTQRIIALLLVCSLLFVGILAFSSTSAHAAAASPPTPKAHFVAVGHPGPEGLNRPDICYLVIYYNYGNNGYCVSRTGYNGICCSLYNVTGLFISSCVNYGWLLEYTGSSKAFVSYNGYGASGPPLPWGKVTQVDVENVSC